MAKYSFCLGKDKNNPDWLAAKVNQVEGFELQFKYQQFNTTKRLIIPTDTYLSREEAEDILREMTAWLMKNHYSIVTSQNVDVRDLPMAKQFQLALDDSEMTVEQVAEQVGCKLSRIRHIVEERYETINLAMFLKALEVMGYGMTLVKKYDVVKETSEEDEALFDSNCKF